MRRTAGMVAVPLRAAEPPVYARLAGECCWGRAASRSRGEVVASSGAKCRCGRELCEECALVGVCARCDAA